MSSESPTLLYRWPANARFDRAIPKTKFYEQSTVSAKLRERFVAAVQRITWAYKLADETVHLKGSAQVPEIQIFAIEAKSYDVPDEVLAAIDKAIPYPIIFEVSRGEGADVLTRMVAAHKSLVSSQVSLTSYFRSEWTPADAPRVPIPTSTDLARLYEALLTPLLPLARRVGEPIPAAAARFAEAQKTEREIARLEQRLRNEPQFNRKVELRAQLLKQTATLEGLVNQSAPEPQDTPWKS